MNGDDFPATPSMIVYHGLRPKVLERGFPVQEERLDILFSIPVVWVTIALSVAFSVLLIGLLVVNRKYLACGQPRITEET